MNAQRAGFDEYPGPCAREQLLVADNRSRPIDEGGQHVESAPAKGNALPVFQEEAPRLEQSKWTEPEDFRARVGGPRQLGAFFLQLH
jgi:hypothetical protein